MSTDINELFNTEDRAEFVERIMDFLTGIQGFKQEILAGSPIIPQLDLVSLGEWVMLMEMIRWAATQLLHTLDDVTAFAQATIEEKTASS